MRVLLTFDVEIWCNDWAALDDRFPTSFDRYIWGRSARGEYALPKTLEILARNGLKAVFFVEPLFAARFGVEHLRTIVQLITDAGQDVQLHLHPEWVDEIQPPLIADATRKRQHLTHYTLAEQTALLAHGLRLLREAGIPDVYAFRAGSYACNRDTFRALSANKITADSSLNACYAVSAPDLPHDRYHDAQTVVDGVQCFPVTTFVDGFGRLRPAQLAGCGFAELRQALRGAARQGIQQFVIVSHNFEMLKPDSAEPDMIVVRRFEQLCTFLAAERRSLPTATFQECVADGRAAQPRQSTSLVATTRRHIEQAWRRL